jgi:diguanylate cyclase (GGDEF)-like protein
MFGATVTKRSTSSEKTVEVTVAREFAQIVRKAPENQAYLVVIAGARLGQHVQLTDKPVEIGRGSACAMQLEADSVSRQHARVSWDGSRHGVEDLKSTNGTYVNEHRVQQAVLGDADRLQVGHVLLKYISGNNVELAYHEEIQRLMRYDGLTGVANRTHFNEAFANALWKTRSVPFPISLVVMDLDHFKNINDTHGHAAGDAVLRQAAEAAASQVTGDQLFARVGGEEFAALLPGDDIAVAREVAERIRRAVQAARVEFDGKTIPVTVSLGVAERAGGSSELAEALYERADGQLYAAKSSGRNCVR